MTAQDRERCLHRSGLRYSTGGRYYDPCNLDGEEDATMTAQDAGPEGEMVTVKRRDLEQIAQRIHQVHHRHLNCAWYRCPIETCDRLRQMLGLPDPAAPSEEAE